MDNKKQSNFSRQANPKACQSAESIRKSNSDLLSNKPWPRQSRRPENTSASKNDQQRSAKQTGAKVRPNVDKRPRQRGGGPGGYTADASNGVTSTEDDFIAAACAGLVEEDIGAAYAGARGGLSKNVDFAHGGKKQNLNHLLNFHYASRESEHSLDMNVFGRANGSFGIHRGSSGNSKKHRYNKEQFMQANFQFVVKSNTHLNVNSSPDTLIDWQLIEQINIQTTEEPQCPICLYPPIAAKMTRCGHAYCWPCILHYLALSDKSWRKCPICYEAIHTADLKSTTIVQQQPFGLGDQIAFHLMRRKKGSMFIERYNSSGVMTHAYYPPRCSTDDESKLFSKFLIAKRTDILNIIEREQRELLFNEDSSCPEFIFIQQALDLLKERREKLGEFEAKELEKDSKIKPLIESVDEEKSLVVGEDKSVMNTNEGELVVAAENAIKDNITISESDAMAIMPMAELGDDKCLSSTSNSTKFYYFYQSVDGQNIYLHPLNIKMLQACYGSLDQAPLLIDGRILQKEHHSMDEDHRRKFTCLGHLPLTCQFAVVEVDLQPPLVTEGILKLFKDDVLFRKKERQRRDREERKRERKINEINDRQMGKLIASTANINLSSANEFPTCGFEETLTNADVLLPKHSIDISKKISNRNVSYSSVTVVGGESPSEFWPTLASSPTSNTYNSYQALSTWGKTPAATMRQTPSVRSDSECGSLEAAVGGLDSDDAEKYSTPMRTNLGDVIAEALSHKKQSGISIEKNYAGNNNKKNKKSKKMQPLFSTGMNYNGK